MIQERFPGAVNPNANVEAEDLLDNTPITANYVPWGSYGMYGYYSFYNRNRPPFSYMTIREMLCDPRITFGLWLLKGPIVSSPTFEVETSNPQVEEFILKNLKRFWANSAIRVLKALEWGFSASEVLYRYNPEDGAIHFDTIRDLEPLDCRPVTMKGRIVGFCLRNITQTQDDMGTSESIQHVKSDSLQSLSDGKRYKDPNGNLYIGSPRCLYHLHLRERNPWFGLSRLFGAHVPWWEQWSEDGYRAIRRLWFVKNAFEGGVVYHPPGTIATKTGPMAARDYAREMIEKKRSGGILTLPNSVGPDGTGRAWEYIPPQGNPVPAGLLDYGDLLKDEVLEGMGIPPEIIQSSGETGFGSASGRQVPQMAFYSLLLELKHWLVLDFDMHVLRYLVSLNFGNVQYEITSGSLMEDTVEQNPNDPYGDQNPLQEGEEGNDAEEGKKTSEDLEDALRDKARKSYTKDIAMAHWITIGGQPNSEEGEEHDGGFPVMVDASGKILAGGPRSLKGVNVKEAGKVLSKGKSKRRRFNPNATNSPDRQQLGLPHPNDPVSSLLEEAAGKDPELQKGFLEHLKESHGSLQKRQEVASKAVDLANTLTSASQSQKTGGNLNVKYGKTLEEVARKIEKQTGIPAKEYQDYATELWESEYYEPYEREQIRAQIKQSLRKLTGSNVSKMQQHEERGFDHSTIPNFDVLTESVKENYPSLGIKDDNDLNEFLNEPAEKIPSATSKLFTAEVLKRYAAEVDTSKQYKLHDEEVVNRAYHNWHSIAKKDKGYPAGWDDEDSSSEFI